MISAGIDVGLENTKVVILKDGKVAARATGPSGGAGRAKAVEKVWQDALRQAGLKPGDVGKSVATGQGKWDAPETNKRIVDTLAETKAALSLFPAARSFVGTGADQARAVRYDDKGEMIEYALNQKCAAGLGLFLESQARLLEMSIEEMAQLSTNGKSTPINDQCGVYAALDVVGMVHANLPVPEIVHAINDVVAGRLTSMMNEITLEKEVVLLGGVARNHGVVKALRQKPGVKFVIPDFPEYAAALGAALIALD